MELSFLGFHNVAGDKHSPLRLNNTLLFKKFKVGELSMLCHQNY